MKKIGQVGMLLYGIVAAIVLVLLCINQKIVRTVQSVSGVAYEQKIDSIAFGYQVKQPFLPQYEKLDQFRIYADASACSRDAGSLQVTIADEDGRVVFDTDLAIQELPQYGWVEFEPDITVSTNQTYMLVLESVGCSDFGPKISFFDARLAATQEQKGLNLEYAGMEVVNSALRIAFIYTVPIAAYEYIIYYIFALVVGFFLFGDTIINAHHTQSVVSRASAASRS